MPANLAIVGVIAGVGSAIAFEVGVFKPYREEHWRQGWKRGIQDEWNTFAEKVREEFDEISGDFRRRRESMNHSFTQDSHHHHHHHHHAEQEEEMQLRREVDDFSLHEAQVSGVKRRFADEFDQGEGTGGARLRKSQTMMEVDSVEDRLVDAPTLRYHSSSFRAQDDNTTLRGDDDTRPLLHHNIDQKIHDNKATSAQRGYSLQSVDGLTQNDSDSSWHSPRSIPLTHTTDDDNDVTISDEWQDNLSQQTRSHPLSEEGEDGSETWTQLDDSRSPSPMSPSWSETELVRGD